MKKFARLLLTASLTGAMVMAMAAPAFAEDTTYTIRILSGKEGTYSGQSQFTGLHYGDTVSVTIDDNTVSLKDSSKYYVKGLKDAGKDNTHTTSNSTSGMIAKSGNSYTITVEQDMDYVVTYGLEGSAIAYTVNYVNEAGQELLPSETYYGDLGDKPVISYLYINGYQPQAYNLTKTLVADSSQNVFTFVYKPVPGPTTVTETVTAPTTPGTTPNTTPNATPNATPDNAAPADNTVTDNAGEAPAPEEAVTEEPAEEVTQEIVEEEAPQELIDLDDAETPLANNAISDGIGGGANGAGAGLANMSVAQKAGLGIGIAAVVVVAALLALLGIKKKKNDELIG